MPRKKNNIMNVIQIFQPNSLGYSKWKTREELEKTPLKLSNNGNCRHGIFYNVNNFNWDKKYKKKKLIALKLNGYNKIKLIQTSNPISNEIKNKIRFMRCINCGQDSNNGNTIPDHKNDLYNELRVKNIKLQKITDFQPLCIHCNLLKRNISQKERISGEIFSAKNMPKYKYINFKFHWEPKILNVNDIYSKYNSYWYDIEEFDRKVYYHLTFHIPLINQLNLYFQSV